ncbi:MAG TPA: CarD family transcriptional regulator [Gemmatimonadaceae bacterium]|nr:CarD family transcriptional regulator [Gemmatimonadaceae bacterium]
METFGELSLAVDDVVVYASHGVGRVVIRREQSVVVEFANSGLSVILPIERALACMRPVSSEAEIASIGQTLGGTADVHSNWQRRLKATRAKVTGGEAVGLAEVIRDASRRDERASARNEPGKLSLTERQLYLKARQLLADEIGASRDVDPACADKWIGEQIAVNAALESLPQTRGSTSLAATLEATAEPSGNRARRRHR